MSPAAPGSAADAVTGLADLAERWSGLWPEALGLWSRFTRLHSPRLCLSETDAAAEGLSASFAMIRMQDQSVVISLPQIVEHGLEDFALEVLGHEVGHHVLCPANLADSGRMVARMRHGLPGKEQLAPFVGNLYGDLLINDRLQRGSDLRMAEVYRRLRPDVADAGNHTGPDRLWAFYLRIYELLWRLDRESLGGGTVDARTDSDAQLGARLVRSYARHWLDGSGRFAALCLPYLEGDGSASQVVFGPLRDAEGTGGAVPDGLVEIDPDELTGAIHPALDDALAGVGADRERRSRERSRERLGPGPDVHDLAGNAPGQYREPFEYGQILRSLGVTLDDHEVAVRYYRERAMPHLIPFPTLPSAVATEPLPEGLGLWDLGSDLESVDWVESAARSPVVIPGVTTLERQWGTSSGSEPGLVPLDLDLYVDCSGSMPNPQIATSYLALAGAVVALSCLRVGGRVQATLWSGTDEYETTAGFVADERAVLRILTGYIGGSTAFPIHLLRDTYASRRPSDRPAHVLVISDDGVTTMFADDERATSGWDVALTALRQARGGGTLVLNLGLDHVDPDLDRAAQAGWVVDRVQTWESLVAFARSFSRRKFTS